MTLERGAVGSRPDPPPGHQLRKHRGPAAPVAPGRVPPHDLDAEMSVIGSILLDPLSIAKIAQFLRPEDYYLENNGQIYRAALDLVAAGEPIDNVTLAAQLQKMGLLDRIGGRAQLASMQGAVPTAANIEHYGNIVRECADRRGLARLLAAASSSLRDDGADAVSVLADLEAQLPRIGNGLWRRAVPSRPSVAQRLDTIAIEKIVWGWLNHFAFGCSYLLDGDAGLGKTSTMLNIIARFTNGQPFPDGTRPTRTGGAVLITLEDPAGAVVRPRFEKAGGDSSRVNILTTIPTAGGGSRFIELPEDLPYVRDACREIGAVALLIDPVLTTLGSKIDIHNNRDVNRAWQPISALARELDLVAIGTRHLNKATTMPGQYRGMGSVGFGASVRGVVVAGKDPDAPDTHRVLAWQKNSYAAPQPSLRYQLVDVDDVLTVQWEGESSFTADQLMASATTTDEDRGALADAKDFLADFLSTGAVATKTVQKHAFEAGIKARTLVRAREALGVRSSKAPGALGHWMLALPTRAAKPPRAPALDEEIDLPRGDN